MPRRTYDRTGNHRIRRFVPVRIVNRQHSQFQRVGIVSHIEYPHLWIWMRGQLVRAHRGSISVVSEIE